MKKIVMLMMVAMLILGVSGQAMAAFDQGDLIRVVYNNGVNGTGNEFVTDLGNFSSLTTPLTSNNPLTGTGTFSQASVGASSWSNVNVAYFIVDINGNGGLAAGWTSGPATNGGKVYMNGFYGSALNAASNMLTNYQSVAGSASSFTMAQSNPNSYWNTLNAGGSAQGGMGGWVNGNIEKNLSGLSSASYVDQVLYYYGSDPDNAIQGSSVATLRTFADGSTQLVAATPIPAALYLFGSSLVGLVGLRRKMSA